MPNPRNGYLGKSEIVKKKTITKSCAHKTCIHTYNSIKHKKVEGSENYNTAQPISGLKEWRAQACRANHTSRCLSAVCTPPRLYGIFAFWMCMCVCCCMCIITLLECHIIGVPLLLLHFFFQFLYTPFVTLCCHTTVFTYNIYVCRYENAHTP